MMDARNSWHLGYQLENFARELFTRHGFTVDQGHGERDTGYDFTLETLERLHDIARGRLNIGGAFGILVTNSRLSSTQRSHLQPFPCLRIYDFDVVSALAAQYPLLALQFEDINRSALVFRGEDLPTAQPTNVVPLIAELGGANVLPPVLRVETPPESPQTGAQLCAAIHDVGESVAKPFEKACEAAVRYLFKDELVAFDDQHGSHAGHNIFDLVARIASEQDFWQALITDFRARYIVFEFKNYDKKTSQREIYTTEKYLYPAAMRGAAIIISRQGADSGADLAMRGALRESGKLILSLSVSELCKMLEARDSGSDHLVTLVSKLDHMLMGLER